jgi:hypothetical protein
MAAAIAMALLAAHAASAQFVVGPPPAGGVAFGYPRGRLVISGSFSSPSPWAYSAVPVIAAPYSYVSPYQSSTQVVLPTPRITINNNYYGGTQSPILGSGYSSDTRGVDLDVSPPKKSPRSEPDEPAPEVPEPPAKPMPGVDVSKPRPSVRPSEAPPKAKLVPKDLPRGPVPPPPAPPQPFDDLREEAAQLVEMGLLALGSAEYGSAALRFRQAIAQDPKLSRAYFYLAQSEFAKGEYRAAVKAIHAGMKVDRLWPRTPIQPRADLFRGREAEFTDLLKRLTDTLADQPNQPTLLFLTAHQLWFDGRRAEALVLFQKARPLTVDRTFIDAFLAAGGPGQLAKLPGAP